MSAHKRPEPLLTRAHVAAAIGGLVSLLVTLGVLPAALGNEINGVTTAVVSVLGVVVATVPTYAAAWSARAQVTPVADPRSSDGVRLVPAGSAPATVDAAAALARSAAIGTEDDGATV